MSLKKGDFIADGPSMEKGEGMALAKPNRRLHDFGKGQLRMPLLMSERL